MGATRREIREYVAGKLGRYHEITATEDACDDTLLAVPNIEDISGDEERLKGYSVMPRTGATPEWRRITSVSHSAAQIGITRAFTTAPSSTSMAVVGLLDPDEWNKAIDEALIELYFPERAEIPLGTYVNSQGNTVTTKEYDLPDWVQTKGHVVSLRYRHLTTGREEPVARYRLQESAGQVRAVIIDVPPSPAQYTLVIEALRAHRALDDDDSQTLCPQPLWQAAVEVSAIHKVYKKYGDRFKREFGQDLAIAERKLLQMRAQILPVVVARDYTDDGDWSGPDIDSHFFSAVGWWD